MDTPSFKFAMTNLRTVKTLVIKGEAVTGQNKGEMLANVTLAFRHLEDAAMRFGKGIQAAESGVSPLGGPDTPTQA